MILKGDAEFYGGPEQADPFQALKKAFPSDPVLRLYDETAPTALRTTANGYGIGTVLVQIQDGQEKEIAYASRTLLESREELLYH